MGDGKIKPGEVRNPKGRPKGSKVLAPAIRRIFKDEKERDKFAAAIVKQAQEGNSKAIEVVRAALDGPEVKMVATAELTTEQILDVLAADDADEGEEDAG